MRVLRWPTLILNFAIEAIVAFTATASLLNMALLVWAAVTIVIFTSSSSVWASPSPELTLKDHGKVIKTSSVADLRALARAETVKVWDANEEDDITFEAYPVAPLLEKVFGPSWKKSEEILFTCADGYQPSIPVSRFESGTAYLAFKRLDTSAKCRPSCADDFSMINFHERGKRVNLAPFYLIWKDSGAGSAGSPGSSGSEATSAEHSQSAALADAAFWPYQVTTLDLETFAAIFPKLVPPEKSSASAKRGFLEFRRNCLGCHTLNGDGGKGGPELNYPVNITEYYKEPWLKKWILDPTSIRFKTGMPGLSPEAPHREQTADDIIAYFKAMAKHKAKPDELAK